jgi:predicted nuclease of predicted toxin-antitoxin system
MKVLLDSCLCADAADRLRQAGHDVLWAGEMPKDPGDEQLLDLAARSGRVLVTLDKDFGELAVVKRTLHRGLIRLVSVRAKDQGHMVERLLATYEKELAAGAILIAEPRRVRIRPG